MIGGDVERDAAANLLERRWFSCITAVRTAEAECEVLREVLEIAESAWRRARTQLAELECLRDALGDQVAALDTFAVAAPMPSPPRNPRIMSAA
jgi:hypothetical protein